MGLWSQLKQRRMTQIVVGYLATGWMALAVVDQFTDREILPSVVYEVSLTLYLVGTVAALIVGWYHGEKGEQKAPLREVVLLGVVAAVALGSSGLVLRNSMQQATLQSALVASGLDLRRIGVLFFEDVSASGSQQALAERITEELISSLSAVAELEVTSRNAARAVQGSGLAPDSVARMLSVGTLVDGTVDQVGEEIRVSVRVLEGRSGIPLFREAYSWPSGDIATVSTELAEEVALALREQLGLEVRLRRREAEAPNAAAWLQVARAERLIRDGEEALSRGDGEGMQHAFEAADAELVAARASAPEWAAPLVLRSRISYERWRLTASDEEEMEVLDRAVALADSALALDPDNAAALEWRGTARYRRWLLAWDDEATSEQLLATARADLERARRLDQTQASVNSTLSHLYYQTNQWAEAVLAARQAYDQDAFLTSVDQVLRRLYLASYDLGQHEDARNWCLEGRRRFPDNFRFVQCQIYVMTMPGVQPDVSEAWRLYDEMLGLMPEGGQNRLLQGVTQTFIGGVIGLAGLPDSADAVMVRARVDPDTDPTSEQMSMEAAMRAVMGDVEGAVDQLGRFMARQPGHFPGEHWWWQNLQGDPSFQRLRTAR